MGQPDFEPKDIEEAVARALPAAPCSKCGRLPFEQCPRWRDCPQGRAYRPAELGEPIPRTDWIPGTGRTAPKA